MFAKVTLFFCISLLVSTTFAEMRHFPGRSQMFSTNKYYKPTTFLRHLEDDSINNQLKSNNNGSTQPVTMRLKGDTELGYYYVTLFFGTPLQKQTLIVDTGSTTTTIPCDECGNNCGSHHFDKPFNHDQSETFEKFKCLDKFGDYVCGDCTSLPCSFSVSYVEGSSYRGHFTRDYVAFGNEIEDYFSLLTSTEPEQVDKDEENRRAQQDILQGIINQRKTFLPFGCTDKETKLFYDQEADGILGLGVNTNTRSSPPNLLDALNLKNSHYATSFSLCLAQSGGYFTVGGHNTAYHDSNDKIRYTRYYEEYGQYRVYLKKIEINGKDLGLTAATLNHGEGAFFDSGTTLAHMPSDSYNSVRSHITSYCAQNANNCGKNANSDKAFCWIRDTNAFPTKEDFFNTFPTFKFYFGQDGDAEYEWRAEDYLFNEQNEEKYCLGLARYDRETILGGTFMKNHDVLFDKKNKRLGFVRANCAAVNDFSALVSPTDNEEPKSDPSEPVDNTKNSKEPGSEEPVPKEQPNTDSTTFVTQQDKQWDNVKTGIIIFAVTALVGGLIYTFVKSRKNRPYFKDLQKDVELPSGKALGTSFDASIPDTQKGQKKGANINDEYRARQEGTNTVGSSDSNNSDIGIAI